MRAAALPEPIQNVSGARLSLIIPAYNEERRIADTLDVCLRYFAQQPYSAEIIVVDDGSLDRTAEIVRMGYPGVALLSYPDNRGKGFAVKTGVLAASGEFRLFYDADGSTPISELEKVWPIMEQGADIVIGSRALPDSEIAVKQPWYRQNMGRIYNVLLRVLMLTQFPDTQCGFKVMNAASAKSVMPLLTRNGFGMDCEALAIAARQGFRVEQIPVRWLNSKDSRVRIVRDSFDMIREVLIVRRNLLTGRYRQ